MNRSSEQNSPSYIIGANLDRIMMKHDTPVYLTNINSLFIPVEVSDRFNYSIISDLTVLKQD